jgi:outer membrane PBP1 activator LpoA protein
MLRSRQFVLFATLGLAAASAVAQTDAPRDLHVYQQRTSDGRIVLTDRPTSDAVTERSWQIAPEDPDLALQRRDDARRDAQALSERLQRRLDHEAQRDHELTLARIRLAEVQARAAAEQARAQAEAEPPVLLVWRLPHPRPPRFPRPPHPRLVAPHNAPTWATSD